jgi:hypothetical protein
MRFTALVLTITLPYLSHTHILANKMEAVFVLMKELARACEAGDVNAVRRIFDAGVDHLMFEKETPLYTSCRYKVLGSCPYNNIRA